MVQFKKLSVSKPEPKVLNCSFQELTTLPIIPEGTTELKCSCNQLTSLPKLPNSLTHLRCWDNKLISLPELPKGLTILDCTCNQLTELPELPKGLTILDCTCNQLTELPELSKGLKELDCSRNQLTSLPELPNGLICMSCDELNLDPNFFSVQPNEDLEQFKKEQKEYFRKKNAVMKISNTYALARYNPYCELGKKIISKMYPVELYKKIEMEKN